MEPTRYRIEVPPDASHGVTLRLFAGATGSSLGLADASVEDLRLVVSELLGNAVERPSGADVLSVTLEGFDDGVKIVAAGVGDVTPVSGPIDRWGIVSALCDDFATEAVDGGSFTARLRTSPSQR